MHRRPLLRTAAPRDAAVITGLLHRLGYPAREDGVRDALATTFRDGRHAVAVAEAAGTIVGLVALAARPSLTRGGWVGVLEALVVREDCRRRGIGEALLQYAKGLAAERGLVRLEATVAGIHAGEAEPFLLALGFEPGGAATFCWGALEARHPRVPVAARRVAAAMF
jgi:N-acetylglutamate synthase-like GNAT family acetyltransferase